MAMKIVASFVYAANARIAALAWEDRAPIIPRRETPAGAGFPDLREIASRDDATSVIRRERARQREERITRAAFHLGGRRDDKQRSPISARARALMSARQRQQ